MRRVILYLFLLVIYDEYEIEAPSELYEFKDEKRILEIEIVCPEGHDDCNKNEPDNPSYEEIVDYINEIVR